MSTDNDFDLDIQIVSETFLESEIEQVAALHRTFDRIFHHKRFDIFNNVIARCIDNAHKEKMSGLLAVALWAKKIKDKVPLYSFFIGAIESELQTRGFSEKRIKAIMNGLQ